MSEQETNLYQRILDVKSNIEGFTKDAEGYKYNYVEGSQILHKIRKAMEENHLLIYPSVHHADYKDIQVLVKGNMKPNILVEMNMTYTFINTDNPKERLEIPFYAIGHQDDASKAYGTALTYAERYFLLKFFNIPTDEDDADAKQKKEKYTKADDSNIKLLQKHIEGFAQLVKADTESVKAQLKIIKYEKLSIAETMQAIQTLNAWKQDIIKQNQGGQSS
ncbi:single-stranded DNA-binding protein [Mammaliicoccus sciuri]|uniref:ERF family protein n=1 Tax=Mammaliicoccus sciuri TaxID=1296 RepID=UPI000E6A7B5B|nr:ERF family protein [Mammaliicoccus sciuri]RIN84883.1 single-stranded DNA-binding protein [Mammaliicoccus sciuri]